MAELPDRMRDKVQAIFREIAGEERATSLRGDVPSRVMGDIARALTPDYAADVAADIAFHLGDWQSDAAFLVALHLFPERFTPEEIDEGVRSLLLHVPAHVIAAAGTAGYSTEDLFHDDNAA